MFTTSQDARLELEETKLGDTVAEKLPAEDKSLKLAAVGVAGVLIGLASALFLGGSHDATSLPETLRFTIKAEPSLGQLTAPSISPD